MVELADGTGTEIPRIFVSGVGVLESVGLFCGNPHLSDDSLLPGGTSSPLVSEIANGTFLQTLVSAGYSLPIPLRFLLLTALKQKPAVAVGQDEVQRPSFQDQ